MRRLFRGLAGCEGQSLLEAAMITPLLLLITFSIVDFASLSWVYLSLENGVSQATRYAITGNAMDDGGGGLMTREGSIMSAMRQATPSLTISDADFTFTHMAPGGNSWVGGSGGPDDIGRVTVNHTWTPLTPVLRPFLTNGHLSVSVDSAMKNEARWE